jgi:hypothetical protein
MILKMQQAADVPDSLFQAKKFLARRVKKRISVY